MTERPKYLTLKEAGELARAPVESVRKWIYCGKLQAFRPGRRVLVREADVIALIENSETVTMRARNGTG